MSFLYPTGIASGYSGMASYLASRIGSVTGSSALPAPASPTGNDGFLQAMADGILGSVGLQAERNNSLGANNNGGSSSYADVPGSSFTFMAAFSGVYTVHADFAPFFSTGTNPTGNIRLVVNGSNGPEIIVQVQTGNQSFINVHLMHAALCGAGANTIKLQWKTSAGTMATTTGSVANYIVSG